MVFHGVASIISGLLSLILGGTVFFRGRHSNESRVFVLLCLAMFLWLINYGLMELSSSESQAMVFAKLGHSSVIFAPILYLHFTRYVLNLPQLARFYRPYYLFGFLFLYFLHTTRLFISAVVKQSWGFYPVGGVLMLTDALILAGVALWCWAHFITSSRKAKIAMSYSEYNRMKYCCIALFIYSLGALDYLPKFGFRYYYPLGFATNAVFVSLVTYAILVHRLMDINLVIRKSLIYSTLVAVITIVYLTVVVLVEKTLQGFMGYRSVVGTVLAAFVIALVFIPVRNAIQRWVDRVFFGGSQEALAEENEKLRQELTRSEKLKAVSTLAAGMAHEIKNPLASIKTFTEFLPEKYDDADFREKFTRIVVKEVGKINTLVHRLLDFAKPAPPQKQPVRLSSLVDETVEFLQSSLVGKQIRVTRAYSQQDLVSVDPGQMKQVFLNILLNSIEAMERGGCITISSVAVDGHLEVLVADTGPGIPKKDLARVFDPFYTTKPSGTGLGLSVVHSIVTEHGGRVVLESDVGRGTTLRIQLPLADIRHQTSDGFQVTEDREQKSDVRRE